MPENACAALKDFAQSTRTSLGKSNRAKYVSRLKKDKITVSFKIHRSNIANRSKIFTFAKRSHFTINKNSSNERITFLLKIHRQQKTVYSAFLPKYFRQIFLTVFAWVRSLLFLVVIYLSRLIELIAARAKQNPLALANFHKLSTTHVVMHSILQRVPRRMPFTDGVLNLSWS